MRRRNATPSELATSKGKRMTEITRRSLVLGAMTVPFATVPFAPLVRPAHAQTAPGNVIKITVPFPPGGTVDPIARMVQPGLQQRLGATVIIENKPGASGSLGTAQVAKSPPDGSNWVFVFDTHAVNPFLQTLPFDTEKELEPVLLIGTAPNIIATHPSRPFQSFADVLAAAKAKPATITYASIGNGSLGHLTGVLLTQRAGVQMVHVPYRGGGPAMNDALAGHVDLIIGSAALVTPQIKGGKLRALGQTGKTRITALPDIPTAIESGFPGFESYAWWGSFTAGGTSKPIVERFSKALAETLREAPISKTLTESLQITLRLNGPEEQRQFLVEQMKLWGPVVKEHNIKGDV
jgi:tripartite-type tricarboxylate transporter receptor subunit TctC